MNSLHQPQNILTAQDVRFYLLLLRRRIWVVVVLAMVGAAAAFAGGQYIPQQYEARTTVLVYLAPASDTPTDFAVFTSERLIRTYVQVLQKRPVIEQVIDNLQLVVAPEQLHEQLQVSYVRDTQLIEIRVQDSDAGQAARIANEFASVFLARNLELNEDLYQNAQLALEQQLAALERDIERTQTNLDQLTIDPVSFREPEYDQLRMTLLQYRNTYSVVLHNLEQVRLAEIQAQNHLHVIESAALPTEPVQPRPMLYGFLGLFAGGMTGLLLVTSLLFVSNRVQTPDEGTLTAGYSTLSAVGWLKPVSSPLLATSPRRRFPLAHMPYALLQVRLAVLAETLPLHSLLITSSVAGEGKTTTAINLALHYARAGWRTVLVDTNLHRPTLHTFFAATDTSTSGVLSLLADENLSPAACLLPTPVEGLRWLPAGQTSSTPAPLNASRLAAILDALQATADIILLDGPPLLSGAEASLLAHSSSATLLVVRLHAVDRAQLAQARELLDFLKVSCIGTVINGVAGLSHHQKP